MRGTLPHTDALVLQLCLILKDARRLQLVQGVRPGRPEGVQQCRAGAGQAELGFPDNTRSVVIAYLE